MTVVRGNADWKPCLTRAAQLILDVYGYSDAVLTDDLKKEKAKLWDHWVRGWSKDLPSGMFCRMYYPKLGKGKSKQDVCPPVLVFRGSEMEKADIDELAVHVEISGIANMSGLPGFLSDRFAGARSFPFQPTVPTISPSGRFAPTATRADLRAAGLVEQPLVLPSRGQEVIATSLGNMIGLGNITIDWQGSASLFYGKNGDWPTNIGQALGNFPPQYREAIAAGKRAAAEAMAEWNGRLMIVGHSLGGGLASAAALAAKRSKPALALRCNTYNAAGLHEETARKAGSRRSDAASAGIVAHCVNGDVLSSIQTPALVPLLSDVLRWGGVTLPPAVPTAAPTRGVSPGGSPSMMFTHFERAPKWAPLPILFPIPLQTQVPRRLTTLTQVFAAAAQARDFPGFVGNLIAMLFRALGDQNGALRSWHLYDFFTAQNLVKAQLGLAGGDIVRALKKPPPFTGTDTFFNLGDSDYLRNQVTPFFNGLTQDVIDFSRIMMAAVDFHMWDTCAYTFVMKEG